MSRAFTANQGSINLLKPQYEKYFRVSYKATFVAATKLQIGVCSFVAAATKLQMQLTSNETKSLDRTIL